MNHIGIIIVCIAAGFYIFAMIREWIAIGKENKKYEAETERMFPTNPKSEPDQPVKDEYEIPFEGSYGDL